jgi:hypothetical protein
MGVWDFIRTTGTSAYEVAKRSGVARSALYRLKDGKGITFTSAWRLRHAIPEITYDGIARECGLEIGETAS